MTRKPLPPGQLTALMARIERAQHGGERERAEREAHAQALTERRRERLQRERVPLRAEMETAIAAGGGTLSEGTSLRAVRRWLVSSAAPGVLMLTGDPGCGKTVAAALALAERGGRWRHAAQIVRTFAARFGPLLDEQELVLSPALLVIDDLGGEDKPQLMAAALLEILDRRQYGSSRYRTVITCRLDREATLTRYVDRRLLSRFCDRKLVAWVRDKGPDRRLDNPGDKP